MSSSKDTIPLTQFIISDNGCVYPGCQESGTPTMGGRLCSTHSDELGYCMGCGRRQITQRELYYLRDQGMCRKCIANW